MTDSSPPSPNPLTFTIIFCAWQAMDYLPESLTPWIEARRNAKPGEHQFRIVAVSVPFVGFDHTGTKPDGTRQYLQSALDRGEIDHIVNGDLPRTEVVARGAALKWALDQGGTTAIWQWDSDEITSVAEIGRIADFVAVNEWTTWFRLSYRNAVFDRHTFLADPFTPPRIHRLYNSGGYVADGFWDDNNVRYTRPWERGKMDCPVVHDVQMASLTIPPTVANPRHWTWLSDTPANKARSKRKVEYQTRGRGWECSFRWDESSNSLRFNESYYTNRGLPLPELIRE